MASKSQAGSVQIEFDQESTGTELPDYDDDDDDAALDPDAVDMINIREMTPSTTFPPTPGLPFPKTIIVLRLNPKIHPDAASYIVKKIKGLKRDGNAELLVKCEPYSGQSEIILHVSARLERFLEMAEYFQFKKVDCNQRLREFQTSDLDAFLYDEITLNNLITPAEKQLIVLHELESLKALPGEPNIPGYPKIVLHSGLRLLHVFQQSNLITDYYPLHDEKQMKELVDVNCLSAFFAEEPFAQLRRYFGDEIALFFIFSGTYTVFLLIPAVLSIVLLVLSYVYPLDRSTQVVAVSFVNLIMITIFLKWWRRACSELAFVWGTLKTTAFEIPRSEYRGRMGLDPVTGEYRPRYPAWKTKVKVGCGTVLVMCCMCLAFKVAQIYLRIDAFTKRGMEAGPPRGGKLVAQIITILPSVGYSICVAIMVNLYRRLARVMTEWENHRTQTQFHNHRIAKLVAFEGVTSFVVICYNSFYHYNLDVLKRQLAVMLSTMHFIAIIQELVIPYFLQSAIVQEFQDFLRQIDDPNTANFFQFIKKTPSESQSNSSINLAYNPSNIGLEVLSSDDPRIKMNKIQRRMSPFRGSYEEYLQLFVQFGFVFLFSPIFPQAAAVAALVNVALIFGNNFKLCIVMQRPAPKRVKDIGTWLNAFEFIGYLAVITNIALIVNSTQLKRAILDKGYTEDQFVYFLVVVGHFILFIRAAINWVIPSQKMWVRIACAKLEYQSQMILKKEQSIRSRRRLALRFQMINPTVVREPAAGSPSNAPTNPTTTIRRPQSATAANRGRNK